MHPERPITKHEADAFDDAVAAIDSWAGEDTEPKVLLHGERCTIGTVCDLIGLFSEPMPAGIYGLLYSLALQHYVEPPDDYIYASGAKCLRAVRNKRVARIDVERQWGRAGQAGAAKS